MTAPQVLAALGFLVCVALLVHHGLGARRQARLAWWWRARSNALRLAWLKWRQRPARPQPPRRSGSETAPRSLPRRASRPAASDRQREVPDDDALGDAEREAADLIERARRGSGQEDNVIRPPQFDEQRRKGPRRDLH